MWFWLQITFLILFWCFEVIFKVNLKVTFVNTCFSSNTSRKKCNTSIWSDFDWWIRLFAYLLFTVIQGRHQKLENHVKYRGLHVYRISMIAVQLITKIKAFGTDIFQKCVFQKRGWPNIFSKGHWNLRWPFVQGQAINWLNFWHNRRKFMILVTIIRVFIIVYRERTSWIFQLAHRSSNDKTLLVRK